MPRPVAIVGFAQSGSLRRDDRNEPEMIAPVVTEALERSGVPRREIGFTCSGSSDFLAGQPFSFVAGLDAIGAWPPIRESHVEMDGAWALYEAWVRLQHGDLDSALVYGFGRSSMGDLGEVLSLQLDPYTVGPLWPDAVSLAALQARALIDTGRADERALAEVAARSRRDAASNPHAQVTGDHDPEALLREPYVADPLRKHDLPPISDGAAAIVLAAGDLVAKVAQRPVWIRGIDHRIEAHSLGARDLTRSPSTTLAGHRAGVHEATPDLAELYAPFSHQELILRDALGLPDGVTINPSGGALSANPIMAAGLVRIGEAASRLAANGASRAIAHATSGPCLQQNLVCVLDTEAA
ncbi:MAG: thiolase domain-containing protein [Actinomycetota bacterium]